MSKSLFCPLAADRSVRTSSPVSLMERLMRTRGISSIGKPKWLEHAIAHARQGKVQYAYDHIEANESGYSYAARCGRYYCNAMKDGALFVVGDVLAALTNSEHRLIHKVQLAPVVTRLTGECQVGLELPREVPRFGGSLTEGSIEIFLEEVLRFAQSPATVTEIVSGFADAHVDSLLVFPRP